jgi:hypothetical protein
VVKKKIKSFKQMIEKCCHIAQGEHHEHHRFFRRSLFIWRIWSVKHQKNEGEHHEQGEHPFLEVSY